MGQLAVGDGADEQLADEGPTLLIPVLLALGELHSTYGTHSRPSMMLSSSVCCCCLNAAFGE